MQKVANEFRLQNKLTDLIKMSNLLVHKEDDEDMQEELEKYALLEVESFKRCIVQCFAALTEKLEDARTELVQNTQACGGLVDLIGSEPELTILQLSAFDLLKSLGRAKLIKKKILRERFIDKKINFVERVSKQFLLTADEGSAKTQLAD